MDILEIDNKELEIVESILLAKGCHFANDAKNVIRCWESVDNVVFFILETLIRRFIILIIVQ